MSYYWMMKRRGNKYNNQKVELDGHKFDSQKEMRRYAELKLLQEAGEISHLSLQEPFVLQPAFRDSKGNKQQAIKYVADFCYLTKEGEYVIEDVKSPATRKNPVYRLKKKMMAFKGYEITEV